MTLNEVTRLLELLADKDNVVSEQRAIEGIRARGVAFNASDANVAVLKNKNPSPAVLATILSLAAPAPPPPPRRPQGRDVMVTCAPGECEIAVNGSEKGRTEAGKLLLARQPFGRLVVQAKKDGYLGAEIISAVSAESEPKVDFKLTPTFESKREFGKVVAGEMLKSVGFTARAKCDLTGQGAASIWSENGSLTEYNFMAVFGSPGLAELEVSGEQGSFALQCRGLEICRQKQNGRFRMGGSKKLPADKVPPVTANLRLFRRNHFCAILDQMTAPGITAFANEPTAKEVNFVSEDATYVVTLGENYLPTAITNQSKSGLGSGMQLTFADFAEAGVLKYPRRTAVRLPDSQKSGIQIRLQSVQSGSTLRESDFPR